VSKVSVTGTSFLQSALDAMQPKIAKQLQKEIEQEAERVMFGAPAVVRVDWLESDRTVRVTHDISERQLREMTQSRTYMLGILGEVQRRVAGMFAEFALEKIHIDQMIQTEVKAAIRAEVQKAVAARVDDFIQEMLDD
jgi:hypothetical protein